MNILQNAQIPMLQALAQKIAYMQIYHDEVMLARLPLSCEVTDKLIITAPSVQAVATGEPNRIVIGGDDGELLVFKQGDFVLDVVILGGDVEIGEFIIQI